MSAENRITKEEVLMGVSSDLSSKAVKLYEQGHDSAAENLTNVALDINFMIETVHLKQESPSVTKR